MTAGRDLPANRRTHPPRPDRDVAVQAPAEGPALPHDAARAQREAATARTARAARPSRAGRSRVAAQPAREPSRLAHALRSAAGLLVVVATSVGVAWGIRHYVTTSPRFAVRTIRVQGTSRRSSEQVVQSAGLQTGKNVFAVDLENTRARILADPWIEKATVTRKLPSTIAVEVTEREAAAAVSVGGDLVLCTHEGELFKRLEPGDPSSLVVITGLEPEQVAADRPAAVRRVRAALELLSDYERRGPSKRLAPGEVHLGEDGTMQMTVGREGVTLELGHAPYRHKVTRAARVLEELERRRTQPGVVFLDNEAHPDRVVVRVR